MERKTIDPEFYGWVQRHMLAGVLRYDATLKGWLLPLEIEDEKVELLEIMTRKELFEYWSYLKERGATEVNIELFEFDGTTLKLRKS